MHCLCPRWGFFFKFFFFFANNNFFTSTLDLTYEKTMPSNDGPHPRYKSESVGLFLLQYDHTDPTLTTNASRWGCSLPFWPQTPPSLQKQVSGVVSSPIQPHGPHPHYKRELVGSFRPQTPPLLQKRVGGVISYFFNQTPPSLVSKGEGRGRRWG